MTKHVISILTLIVVSIIAIVSLLYEPRELGHLTTFGYVLVILTVISFILGLAAEIYSIKEEEREEAEEQAKHVEQKHQLGRIETEVKANTRPLLPVAMFYTLRHTTTTEAIEETFSGVSGFKDIKGGEFLKLIGTVRLGGPLGYNSIELTATESHCILEGDNLNKLIQNHTGFGESAIRLPVDISLEFFLPNDDGTVPDQPTLVLEKTSTGSGKPDEVKCLELFDNVIFQDSFVRDWTVRTGAGQNWSVANLYNARICLRLELMGQLGPVSLHNLQLFFGPTSAMHGIHFPKEFLSSAVFKQNPSPLLTCANDLASEFFASYLLEYECNLSETVMSDHFIKVVAR